LRDRSLRIRGTFWQRDLLWAQALRQKHHLPRALRCAHALKHLLETVPIRIRPGELIVGSVPMGEPPPEKRDELQAAASLLREHDVNRAFLELAGDEERAGLETGTYTAAAMTGHTAINNEKVLRRGLLDIHREVEQRLAALDPIAPETPGRRLFYESCRIALQAALRFAERHAELAERMARSERDAARRKELLEIARICRKVPALPAETFQEALQCVWFMHLMVAAETSAGHGCFCPGRTDRYAWPFLKGDLEAGRLTREEALELLECFFIKYGEWGPHASPQVMIVGGQHPDGTDASNELTLLCLQASRELRLLHPSLALSYHRGTPERVLREAVETLRAGCSYPFIFNDDVIVPGLTEVGVARADAVRYVPCSCVEISVEGRCNAWVASGYHNWGKMLELALHDGVDPATTRRVGPPTGRFEAMQSLEELKRAVREQIRHFVQMEVRSYNLLDTLMAQRMPVPLLSCLVDDCLERGRHYFAGGARYNFIEPEAVGPVNVADSLAAIGRLVFAERQVGQRELLDALRENFAGREELRQRLMRGGAGGFLVHRGSQAPKPPRRALPAGLPLLDHARHARQARRRAAGRAPGRSSPLSAPGPLPGLRPQRPHSRHQLRGESRPGPCPRRRGAEPEVPSGPARGREQGEVDRPAAHGVRTRSVRAPAHARRPANAPCGAARTAELRGPRRPCGRLQRLLHNARQEPPG